MEGTYNSVLDRSETASFVCEAVAVIVQIVVALLVGGRCARDSIALRRQMIGSANVVAVAEADAGADSALGASGESFVHRAIAVVVAAVADLRGRVAGAREPFVRTAVAIVVDPVADFPDRNTRGSAADGDSAAAHGVALALASAGANQAGGADCESFVDLAVAIVVAAVADLGGGIAVAADPIVCNAIAVVIHAVTDFGGGKTSSGTA